MQELDALVRRIILELVKIQESPQPYREDGADFPLPRMISTGNGQFITISKTIDQLIGDIARRMRTTNAFQSHFTADDCQKLVRSSFGPALAKIDLEADLTNNIRSVLADVETAVSARTDYVLNAGEREYAFGCTLFADKNFESFKIGPVRFEPRKIWLERKASDGRSARIAAGGHIQRFNYQIADGPIPRITKRRIEGAWQGKKLKARKPSYDRDNEQDIIAAIGECPYVCSVTTHGFGDKAGLNKALLAARLALTTISLIWENTSKALGGLNLLFDREMRRQHLLFFTSDGLIGGGNTISTMPHAPFAMHDELNEYIADYSGEFTVAGEAITWLLNPAGTYQRPETMNVIAQALLWFHDGCREVIDLKAIVSFASCMEVLAGGDGRESILRLIKARINLNENAPIHRDGLTVKAVIDRIYVDGRNRFLHGPRQRGNHVWTNKLGHDWSGVRRNAEILARLCLINCMKCVASNSEADDPAILLK